MARYDHDDQLTELESNIELTKKIEYIHSALRVHFPFLEHISVAIYDAKTDLLETFLHSGDEKEALTHYQSRLSETTSLMEILEKRHPRVIDDLSIFTQLGKPHTRIIKAEGFMSSYTMPMYERGNIVGFIFFNSRELGKFTEEVLWQLDPYGHLIALLVINDMNFARDLRAAVKTARDISHLRDDETGAHQDRMSRYARLIARKLADHYRFSDEYIEHVFLFAPLHDIGKIGIPDQILLKPGRLSEDEYSQMQAHTLIGRQLVDQLLQNFDLETIPHTDILRNIAEFHHEAVDGSGYPHGYAEGNIPIEARIVAVADVFDALTSRRPYKEAWSIDDAFALLEKLSGEKFDGQCVKALIENREEVEAIQQQFKEDIVG